MANLFQRESVSTSRLRQLYRFPLYCSCPPTLASSRSSELWRIRMRTVLPARQVHSQNFGFCRPRAGGSLLSAPSATSHCTGQEVSSAWATGWSCWYAPMAASSGSNRCASRRSPAYSVDCGTGSPSCPGSPGHGRLYRLLEDSVILAAARNHDAERRTPTSMGSKRCSTEREDRRPLAMK